jgi:preprotein translocase subunit Sec61beta
MAADNKISLPSGMGGITRYFDEYTGKLQLTPTHVIVLIFLLIAFEVGIRLI